MRTLLTRRQRDEQPCGCHCHVADETLVVDAAECPGDGDLATRPACRGAVVDRLTRRNVERVTVRAGGVERVYRGRAVALLVAAGRFVERLADRDALADTARTDPLRAARKAVGRAPPASTVAAETGLAAVADATTDYRDALAPLVGATAGHARVRVRPPDAPLADRRELPTGATVARYDADGDDPAYHLLPPAATLGDADTRALAAARDALADGTVDGDERAPDRAVDRVVDDPVRASKLAAILRKHVRGYDLLEDLLADPLVSDVYVTAPVATTPVRVVVDGDVRRTNVHLSEDGAAALASRVRLECGRAFSRASPTVDAEATLSTGRRVRVAGVRPPVSDGIAFAVRDGGSNAWTLPALVANGTLPADAAALCSLAVERGAAVLVVGPRGAGKTTFLGALCWELPRTTRAVVLEDTPELPVDRLQADGRDVQGLRTTPSVGGGGSVGTTAETTPSTAGGGLPPADALRSALRLGESALVVGEVRGPEAGVLYEAMRVGAGDDAVLGTIHGDGGAAVRERVVTDLGVPASSFLATDLVVTTGTVPTNAGSERRITAIEEVVDRGDGDATVGFEPLYDLREGTLRTTDRVARGSSVLVDALSRPGESYADVRTALTAREERVATLVREGRTAPSDLRGDP